jgi:hypothetical protein
MTRELQEKRPSPDESPFSEADGAPRSRRGRRNEVSGERAAELQARQRAIGVELKRIFDGVTKEPVPQEFLELLQQIDRKRED